MAIEAKRTHPGRFGCHALSMAPQMRRKAVAFEAKPGSKAGIPRRLKQKVVTTNRETRVMTAEDTYCPVERKSAA